MQYFLLVLFFLSSHSWASIAKAPAWSAFESFAFSEDHQHRTNSLLVVIDGKVVFERYRPGINNKTTQQLWSVSKSVAGLIIARAIDDKLLKLSDPVKKFYPKAPDSITIEHLFNMVSGYEWNEGYEYSPFKSDVIAMLYNDQNKDMASFAAHKNSIHKPDEYFQYSSGTTNILMGILAKALGPSDYARYPWRSFFEPLGITSAVWERDHAGTFVGSSYLFLSARDLAKIGELVLTQGRYQDKQVIAKEWFERIKKPHSFFNDPARDLSESEGFAYSHQWWLNSALKFPDGSLKSRYPALSSNAILALGHWGQMMVIIPDKKTILVRTGADKSGRLDRDTFFALFMRALEQAYP